MVEVVVATVAVVVIIGVVVVVVSNSRIINTNTCLYVLQLTTTVL